MDIHDYISVIRKRRRTIMVSVLVALSAAVGVTLATTPLYVATTRLFFAVQAGQSPSDLAQGSTFTERQMASYARVARSPLVLEPVVTDLRLDTSAAALARSVRADVPLGTVILEISATDPDPELAAEVANAVGDQLKPVVASLAPERADGTDSVLATTLAPADVPTTPVTPSVTKNLAVGLLVGLVAGLGLAMLRERLDTRIRTADDVSSVTDRALLGSIVNESDPESDVLAMRGQPHGERAESIRRLRTNLQFVNVSGRAKSIAVTSALPGEGKTTTALDVALALADSGARTILVNADLRKPSVANVTGLEGAAGLTTVLIGQAELADVVQPWGRGRLDVLVAGEVPPNPSELLGSRRMATLMEQLQQDYEHVIVNTAPLLPVTDGAVVAKVASGTLVVVNASSTHKRELAAAVRSLEAVNASVLGVVLNKTSTRSEVGYGYGYGYGEVPRGTAIESVADRETVSAR